MHLDSDTNQWFRCDSSVYSNRSSLSLGGLDRRKPSEKPVRATSLAFCFRLLIATVHVLTPRFGR